MINFFNQRTSVADSEDIERAGKLTKVEFNSFAESDEGDGFKYS